VEAGALVAIALLAGAKLAEIASRLRDDIVVQLESNPASGLGVDCDVKLKA
jgi:hypothetical protein